MPMTEAIALQHLMAEPRAASHPVGRRGPRIVKFEEFQREVTAWRDAFAAHAGQRFALYFKDTLDFSAALFGAWHAGKCVYLPADLVPQTLARLAQTVDGFAGDLPAGGPKSIARGDARTIGPFQTLDPQAAHLVVYTSGTTGEPSAIVKRLNQLFSEVATLGLCWDDSAQGATIFGTVSHQHIYGLLFRVLWPLASGHILDSEQLGFPEDIVRALSAGLDSVLIASPAQLKRLPPELDWESAAKRLRLIFSSGGPLPDSAVRQSLELLGRAPIEIYGSSETGGIARRQRQKPTDLAWEPMPGVFVRVTDERLEVRSAHLFDAEWLTTDDLIRIEPQGFVLLGRADHIEKIEEKRVSITAMERAALACGLFEELRIARISDGHHPLGVAAVPNAKGWALYESKGKNALNQPLRAALAAVAEPGVLPRRFRYVSVLPVNAQGKTGAHQILALFDPRRAPMRIMARDRSSAQLKVEIQPGLPFFDGHFPVAAVLPGVALLELSTLYARELFDLPTAILRMESVKFRQVIVPNAIVNMKLTLQRNATETRLQFDIASEQGAHASGVLVFGAQP